MVEPATSRPLCALTAQLLRKPGRRLGTGADADEIGRVGNELRNLRREIERLGLERDAELDIGAGLFHHVGKNDLAHGLGDHVVGRVGDRRGRSRQIVLLERPHHAAEQVAFIGGVAERVGERLGQLGRRRGHRHRHDAGALRRRKRHAAFARAERADDRQHLVVFGELAQADDRLIGLAGGIERTMRSFLPAMPPAAVDLVDGHLRCDQVGLRERGERTGSGMQIAEHDIVCPRRSRRRYHRSGGSQY